MYELIDEVCDVSGKIKCIECKLDKCELWNEEVKCMMEEDMLRRYE